MLSTAIIDFMNIYIKGGFREGRHRKRTLSLFFATICFLVITLKNYRLYYLKLN